MKLLITSNSFGSEDPGVFRQLEEVGFEIYRNPYGKALNAAQLKELIADMDAVIISADEMNADVVASCRHLKVVSRYGVGVDKIDQQALKEAGIALEITRGANSDAVADHTVGLMLDVAHNITLTSRHYHDGECRKEKGVDLVGSKVGIIGFGAIGKRIARRLRGFDCKIYAHDIVYDDKFNQENGIITADVDTILRTCDFVSLNMPAIREYIGFMNDEKFDLMKPDAILINTARAELVDRDALFRALREKKIRGYGTDVSYCEPLVEEEFNEFDNVVMTPHNAAVTRGAVVNMTRMAAENVLKYFRQE